MGRLKFSTSFSPAGRTRGGMQYFKPHVWEVISVYSVRKLLELKVVTDCSSVLFDAAHSKSPEILDVLLLQDIDIDADGIYGRGTALRMACKEGDHRAALRLLKAGANVDLISDDSLRL